MLKWPDLRHTTTEGAETPKPTEAPKVAEAATPKAAEKPKPMAPVVDGKTYPLIQVGMHKHADHEMPEKVDGVGYFADPHVHRKDN